MPLSRGVHSTSHAEPTASNGTLIDAPTLDERELRIVEDAELAVAGVPETMADDSTGRSFEVRNHDIWLAGKASTGRRRVELPRRRAGESIRRLAQTQAEQSVDVVVDVHCLFILGLMIPDVVLTIVKG